MKRILAAAVCAAMLVPQTVLSQEIGIGQHTDTKNIYIQGALDAGAAEKINSVTVKVYDKSNSENVVYFNDTEVDENNEYKVKFKFRDDIEDYGIDVRYGGKNLNDTIEVAKVSGQSELVDAKVILLNQKGTAISLEDYQAEGMPVHSFGYFRCKDYSEREHSYQSSYKHENASKAKAQIFVNNKYADEAVAYMALIVFYDENGKLLEINEVKNATAAFDEHGDEAVITAEVTIPEGAKSVKSMVWADGYSLIPFNDVNNDKLDKIAMYVVGDSTYGRLADDYSGNDYPRAGIATFIPDYFNTDYIDIYNRSVSGASTISVTTTSKDETTGETKGTWYNIMKTLKKNDYVYITLGINDSNMLIYQENLDKMIKDAYSKGANVILGYAVGIGCIDEKGTLGVSGDYQKEKPVFEALKAKYPKLVILDNPNALIEDIMKNPEVKDKIYGDGTLKREQISHNIGRVLNLSPTHFAEDWGMTQKEIESWSGDHTKTDGQHLNGFSADYYARIFAKLVLESDMDLKYYLR